ncbi:MAG TPA: molybdenum cofactor guanylyltransferase [Bryobacteraceae bacterium]|nr:molybdenum cofactor guanylyltransferase [Bryobacteraceae bacterium]
MQASGFVLAGGASKRMGQDKALLPYRGTTLVEHVAKTVSEATGSVALIGDPGRLGHLGLAVFPDELPSCGPASGIYTALRISETDWNLVLACDMPAVSVEILTELLRRAETSERQCVTAAGLYGEPEPLCAVYHRRCLPALGRSIRDKRLRMRDFVKEIGAVWVKVDTAALANVNTPPEWAEFEAKTS